MEHQGNHMFRKMLWVVLALMASTQAHAVSPISVTVTSPANGSVYTAPASVSLAATTVVLEDSYYVKSVTFLQNGNAVCTDTSAPYGCTWSNVPAGSYSITARVQDNTGDTRTSSAVGITVNSPSNVAPSVAMTGPTSGSSYIATASIPLTASASDSDGTISKVEFYKGTTLIGTDTTSPYGVTWTESAPATYSVTARAYDNAGAVTVSSAISVTVVANTLPAVSITSPANNAGFLAPANIAIAASASDTDGTVTRVDFHAGGTLIASDSTAPYSATWSTGNVGGTFAVSATAVDDKGGSKTASINVVLTSSSGSVSATPNPCPFYDSWQTICRMTISWSSNNAAAELWHTYEENVDGSMVARAVHLATGSSGSVARDIDFSDALNRIKVISNGAVVATMTPTYQWAPTVSITSPAANQVFQAPATISIAANASDQDGTISKVEFYAGTTLLATDTASPYAYTWSGVGAGAKTIKARAYDNHGAVREVSIPVTVNAQPTVALTAPVDGSAYTAPATITITASASDADDAVTKVEFYSGTTLLGSDTASPYEFVWSNVTGSANPYSLSARVYDQRGGTGKSAARSVTVNTLPTVALTRSPDSTWIAAPASATLDASAQDVDGSIAKVEFFQDGVLIATDTTAPYSHAVSGLGSGSYSFTAKAYDNRGATVTSAANVLPVNALPAVSLTSPAAGAVFAYGATVTLAASASDGDDGISRVEFYRDGTLIGHFTAAPYELQWQAPPSGAWTISARAVDLRGGATVSGTADITVHTPPGAQARRYVYDAAQRLCKVIEPETGATVTQYDAAGNVVWTAGGLALPSTTSCDRELVPASEQVARTYDSRHRLETLVFPGGNGNQLWRYTATGLPREITTYNDEGTTTVVNSYAYNTRGLLTGETQKHDVHTWSVGHGYNGNGHRASLVYPSGLELTFSPNALGQPTAVNSPARTYASAVVYYPNGAIRQFTYGNGVVHSMELNARQMPARVKSSGGALEYLYSYDPNGNVLGIQDLARGITFDRTMQYDGLDRLIAAGSASFGGDHWHRFTYDVLDNLTSWRLGADANGRGGKDYAEYYYDPASHLLTSIRNSSGAATVGFGYDVRGNLHEKNGLEYRFDLGNRLRTVHAPDNTVLEAYRYDGHGRRILAKAGAGAIFSLYAQDGSLLWERDERAGKHVDHLYLNGTQIAQRSRPIGSEVETVRFQHTDALGSPVAVTDEAGLVIESERRTYEPYGASLEGAKQGVGYTGHVMDAATGLTYMQQRYYDPQVGRFLSTDPVTAYEKPMTNFNRYVYALNNPYKFTDPDGRNAVAGAAAGCAVTGPACPAGAVVGAVVGTVIGVGIYYGGKYLYNQHVQRSEDASQGAVDKIKDGTRPADGQAGKDGVLVGDGGAAGAAAAIDVAKGADGAKVLVDNGKVTVVQLPDGRKVESHVSTQGGQYKGDRTVKIQDADGKVRPENIIRYPEPKAKQ
jgi:RHS repeat-associated protein